MQEVSFEEGFEKIRAKDPRYHRDAYDFVKEALDHTQKSFAREGKGKPCHVSGPQLLEGIKELALSQFGPMAITVFEEWGVHDCRDFGEIVFNMVEIEMLAKTEKDSRADFEGGYDFHEAFRKPFMPACKQATSERPGVPAPKMES
jgi:uncharacterized repeat protein (TIGR04138 family)